MENQICLGLEPQQRVFWVLFCSLKAIFVTIAIIDLPR